ncbi:hypothetical protein P171DRAFT_181907 [Karstenula rhodostoma CBS 690.94]|uniref:Uncharacterized protein n=1 Tax=Karstenula rhodostoma CBS 690.94 TaxID=1392251 RepID=A0A9P4P4Y0_9PLEO|nr:hypothetical protein P171DRAFT_181907 [Karstenula rhodostoma CBS 690.94]
MTLRELLQAAANRNTGTLWGAKTPSFQTAQKTRNQHYHCRQPNFINDHSHSHSPIPTFQHPNTSPLPHPHPSRQGTQQNPRRTPSLHHQRNLPMPSTSTSASKRKKKKKSPPKSLHLPTQPTPHIPKVPSTSHSKKRHGLHITKSHISSDPDIH